VVKLTQLRAKKKRLDLDQYDEDSIERKVKEVSEGSTVYQELLEQYRSLRIRIDDDSEFVNEIHKNVTRILEPIEIKRFLAYVLEIEEDPYGLGPFISKLVVNSYQEGERKFDLALGESSLDLLLSSSFKLKDLTLTFSGNTGINTGAGYTSSVFNGEHFGKWTGFNSWNCRFIGESFDNRSGMLSHYAKFSGGKFGRRCGDSAIESYFKGEYFGRRCGENSSKCTFTTPNEQTFEQLLKDVTQGNKNTVIFTPTEGEVRRYSNSW
jgi:hypothetical protein